MKLHHKILGEGAPLIILHGLFGMLDNWQSLGKQWSENYQVILVDQRNHGHTEHAPHFNYEIMVDDLAELIDDLFLDEVTILGHSMGGKIAMKFAQTYPNLVKKLIIADIGPKKYPVHHQTIIEGLESVDFSVVKSRKEVDAQLKKYISEEGIRQFFMKNLYWKEKGKLDWRFYLEGISNNIQHVGEELFTEQVTQPTLFIRGGNSNYITNEDIADIARTFPNYELATIPDAGHWLHAENPTLFYELVTQFLSK